MVDNVAARRVSKAVILLFLVVAITAAWHWYLARGVENRVRQLNPELQETAEMTLEIDVNAVTNLVVIKIALPPELRDDDNPFAAAGAALAQGLVSAFGPGLMERELNTRAREQYDVYALIVPYRVRMETIEPSADEMAQWQARREAERRAEENKKRAAQEARLRQVAGYASEYLTLENVRVGEGTKYGTPTTGVFGTIANNGNATLTEVRVRIYFLDSAGRRIGEKEYSPVLVTQFSIGDNTPLRPNYRRDFGYSVEDDAPSGWARDIEMEVVDLEFAATDDQ